MKVSFYARVSTNSQEVDLQLLEIEELMKQKNYNLVDKYIEKGVSGAKTRRPELDRLIQDAKEHKFEILIIWRLDRLGRSLSHLIKLVEEFKSYGVKIISIKDNIDFSTAQGQLMFHLLGAMAQFERELIRERVIAGLESAKAKGKKLGREKDSDRNDTEILKLRNEGLSFRKIALKLNITHSKVQRAIQSVSKTYLKSSFSEVYR